MDSNNQVLVKENFVSSIIAYHQTVEKAISPKIWELTCNAGYTLHAVERIAESVRASDKVLSGNELEAIMNSMIYLIQHSQKLQEDLYELFEIHIEKPSSMMGSGHIDEYLSRINEIISENNEAA